MTEQSNQQAIVEIWELFRETDARFKETDSKLRQYAYHQGLFVLTLSSDNMVRILNDDAFQPRDFGMSRRMDRG